jgi:hypothetical protein
MAIGLDPAALAALQRDPRAPVAGRMNGSAYSARVEIPDYGARIERHYGRRPSTLNMDFPFRHFGLSIAFETPVELAVHDDARRLDAGLRAVLGRFGAVTLVNACLPARARTSDQRNVFQSLSFHIDRGRTQDDNISLFWRDPLDPVHRRPRSSSTLVLANAAAYLQAVKEGHGEHEFKLLYQLFEDEEIAPLLGEVMVELGWRAPEGVGEIALVDNRTVLHASYYARPTLKGYPIAVRYLF